LGIGSWVSLSQVMCTQLLYSFFLPSSSYFALFYYELLVIIIATDSVWEAEGELCNYFCFRVWSLTFTNFFVSSIPSTLFSGWTNFSCQTYSISDVPVIFSMLPWQPPSIFNLDVASYPGTFSSFFLFYWKKLEIIFQSSTSYHGFLSFFSNSIL
jgi:hypothetical protein